MVDADYVPQKDEAVSPNVINGKRLLFAKFSGRWDSGKWSDVGNFIDSKGYWKLLIDRRMYDVNGRYQDLTTIDSREFDPDYVDPTETGKEFKVTQVADNAGVSDIVDNVVERETSRTGTMPTVDYGLNMTGAVGEYQNALNGAEEEDVNDSFGDEEGSCEESDVMFSIGEDVAEVDDDGVEGGVREQRGEEGVSK